MTRSLYLIVTDRLCTRCGHSWRECYSVLRTELGGIGGTPSLFEARELPVTATRYRLGEAPACWRCSTTTEVYHDHCPSRKEQ